MMSLETSDHHVACEYLPTHAYTYKQGGACRCIHMVSIILRAKIANSLKSTAVADLSINAVSLKQNLSETPYFRSIPVYKYSVEESVCVHSGLSMMHD